jgi:hypothetical protein
MFSLSFPRARHRPGVALAVAALVALTGSPLVLVAGAQAPAPPPPPPEAAPTPSTVPSDDPFQRRMQIEYRRQDLLAELDALQATDAELQAVLFQLRDQVEAQTAALEAARAAHLAALRQAERATEAEADKAREVADLEERMRQLAVDTYVSPPSQQRLSVLLQGGDLNDLSKAMVYFDAKFGEDVRIARLLEAARVELEKRRDAAASAVMQAAARSDEVAAVLTELEESQAAYEEVAAIVQLRMGDVDFENAALYAETLQVNAAIERRQREIMALAARQAGHGRVALVDVRGIRVHSSIAAQLEALLVAAEADGIVLRGGGYRSYEAQIQTRRANCGDDPYSVFEKPPGECSPPTARPGTSMHELGLAIDFTYNGSIISSRSSPAFQWLAENAAWYGFYNLPSEPWHWSTNGN